MNDPTEHDLDRHQPATTQAPLDLHALQSMPPLDRLKALIARDDAQQAVRQLSPLNLYHLVLEIGLEDATELVTLASPQQLQIFTDLETWRRDDFQSQTLQKWMESYWLAIPDKELKAAVRTVDLEPFAMLLQEHALIFVIEDPDNPPEELGLLERPWESFDGVYAIVFDDDEDATRLLRRFLARLYDQDRQMAWTLLEATRWELRTAMEEEAYQSRNRRLESLGFVEPTEALAIYAPVDPAKLRHTLLERDSPVTTHMPEGLFALPDLFTKPLQADETFLARCWSSLTTQVADGSLEADLDAQAFALVALTNKALAVESANPGDLAAARQVYRRVLGAMNIALELMAARDVADGVALLSRAHPQELFSAGHAITTRLAAQARLLVGEPMAQRLNLIDELTLSMLDHNDRLLAQALLEPRPLTHDTGQDYAEPFNDLSQVERTAARLSHLAYKITAVFGLLELTRSSIAAATCQPTVNPPAEAVTLDLILRTAVARAALQHSQPHLASTTDDLIAPLNAEELARLIEGPILNHGAPHQLRATPDHTLIHAATPLLIDNPKLDKDARRVALNVTLNLSARLIDELSHVQPARLRDQDIHPHELGDLLLTTQA